jgi:hypothetical protein
MEKEDTGSQLKDLIKQNLDLQAKYDKLLEEMKKLLRKESQNKKYQSMVIHDMRSPAESIN